VLRVSEEEQEFVFEEVPEAPVPSLLRGFSGEPPLPPLTHLHPHAIPFHRHPQKLPPLKNETASPHGPLQALRIDCQSLSVSPLRCIAAACPLG
jgi:hypothetical protein